MRGESHCSWSSTIGVASLSSRDFHALRGPGSLDAMQGSDVYREVLYELQQENSYCEDDEDCSPASDGDESDSRLFRHRHDHDPLARTPSSNAQPGRSILRSRHSSTSEDDGSNKAKRVTFKDSSGMVHSPAARRASVAESNPSLHCGTPARRVGVTERKRAGEGNGAACTKARTNSEKGLGAPGPRARRHSLPSIIAPLGYGVGSEDSGGQGRSRQDSYDSEDDAEQDGKDAARDDNDDDNDNDDDDEEEEEEEEDGDSEVKCEVVHSFTPRRRVRRSSYAGISGYERSHTVEEPVPPRTSASPKTSNVKKSQPKKKTSPTCNDVVRNGVKKMAGAKGSVKGGAAKGRKETPSGGRRHSIF